jgi:hypothetical protein
MCGFSGTGFAGSVWTVGRNAQDLCGFTKKWHPVFMCVLPCSPLPGVKHLVCSKARPTSAPLSMLVMESTCQGEAQDQRYNGYMHNTERFVTRE